MPKTFTLTAEQIVHVFCAGVTCGQDAASSYEWGCKSVKNTPSGRAQELVWEGFRDLDLSYEEQKKLEKLFTKEFSK